MAKQETAVESITMKDGRVIEFTGKRKALKETLIVDGKVTVRIDFRNGETSLFTVPDAMLLRFAGHGAEQKLGDSMAGIEAVDDCQLAVDELIDQLYNGEWNARKEGSGFNGASILLKALCEHTGKDAPTIKAFLSKKSHAEKLALRNSAKVKPIVERLEAEKAARSKAGQGVDTAALEAELEGIGG